MYHIKFEKLLGKNLSITKEILDVDLKRITSPKLKIKLYGSKNYIEEDYYGIPYKHLSLTTDENDTTETITVHFFEVINRKFYDSFMGTYGKPDSILVMHNPKNISKQTVTDTINNLTQEIVKREFDLREGTFEEKPLYIIWEKDNYQVKAFLRHKQNISEIIFSVKK